MTVKEENALSFPSRQLLEVASWRFVADMVRRYPDRLRLIETHPASSQGDCLTLLIETRAAHPARVDFARPGGVWIWKSEAASNLWPGFWHELLTAEDPHVLLQDLCDRIGLPNVSHLPETTAAVLSYRFIAAFLSHSAFGRRQWQCRSAVFDGDEEEPAKVREEWFDRFPIARERSATAETGDLHGLPGYRFWFLVEGGQPGLCLETNGMAWDRRGREYDLTSLYQPKRRVWPIVALVAGDLLP